MTHKTVNKSVTPGILHIIQTKSLQTIKVTVQQYPLSIYYYHFVQVKENSHQSIHEFALKTGVGLYYTLI